MKTLKIILFVMILCVNGISYTHSQTLLYDEYYTKTTFLDSFTSSVPNPAAWNIVNDFARGAGVLIDSSATVNVSSGNLELTMISCPGCTGNGEIKDYAGAELISKDAFKYGIFECRAKFAEGNGAWPAFWLIGGNHMPCDEAFANEIDMFEFFWFDRR